MGLAPRLLNIANATLMLFLGHFHPLLVHLPIGGLVLLAVLELVAHFTRFSSSSGIGYWSLHSLWDVCCRSCCFNAIGCEPIGRL